MREHSSVHGSRRNDLGAFWERCTPSVAFLGQPSKCPSPRRMACGRAHIRKIRQVRPFQRMTIDTKVAQAHGWQEGFGFFRVSGLRSAGSEGFGVLSCFVFFDRHRHRWGGRTAPCGCLARLIWVAQAQAGATWWRVSAVVNRTRSRKCGERSQV